MWTSIVILLVSLTLSYSQEVASDEDPYRCIVSVTNYGVDQSREKSYPRSCTEIHDKKEQASSGDYMIRPHDEGDAFRVYCDMDTDGGGWTVFQRREDGSVEFYRDWSEYKAGFGNVNSEHWLGNDKIHRISSDGRCELRVDMSSFEEESAYAHYGTFRVGDELGNYKLFFGDYTGDAGDSLTAHRNASFSTYDRDNDEHPPSSCAVLYKGGWWYNACHYSNPNGLYLGGMTDRYAVGVVWQAWKGYYYSLKTIEMKMRCRG